MPARKTPVNKHDRVREYEAFVFLDLTTPGGRKELRRQVDCQDGARPGRSGLTPPAERLLDLIETRGYSAAVLEHDYIDIDHRAALARFYRLRHRDTAARCVRVHLFEKPVDRTSLETGLQKDEIESYRGFLVLRPFSHETLGRCILSGDLLRDQNRTYVTCKAPYSVNLAGHEIKFDGTPWMEQDGMVSACASAALWVIGWHLGHFFRGGHRLYTTPEITELATQYNLGTGRAMPSGGLNIDQMCHALHAMGYAPLLFGEYETLPADLAQSCVYTYVESGIPALLNLQFPLEGGHAVALVGHRLEATARPEPFEFAPEGKLPLKLFDASQFASRFVAQDDAGGPFRLVEFLDRDAWVRNDDPDLEILRNDREFGQDFDRLEAGFTCGVLFDRGTENRAFAFLGAILIPSPPRVTLGYREALTKAYALLIGFERTFRPLLKGPLVLRAYLRRSNAVKADCRATELNQEVKRRICWHPMPKWVWVAEITDLRGHRKNKAKIAGLILLDAAGHADAEPKEDLILLLTPQALVLGYPDPKRRIETFVVDQPPFSRYERPAE